MLKTKRKATVPQEGDENQALSFKERLAKKKKAERLRKEIINFTIFAFGLAAIAGVLVGFGVGDPKAGIGTSLGLLYTSLSFKYPRYAMYGFLIYLPFGGTITYTLGNSPLLQLAKDGFYVPALFGVIQFCRREQLPILISKPLKLPLIILFIASLLTLIFVNGADQMGPHNGQPLAMGILGLKVFIGYVPLMTCAYYFIRNRNDLLGLIRLNVILILTCCGLAFMQYLFLKTGRCQGTQFAEGEDLFKASLNARCLVGGALLYSPEHGQIRLPGTFVAPWQWGWYLISSAFLSFGPAFNDPKPHWRTLSLASLAAVFVLSVVSGQRIALALVPVSFVLLLILTGQIIQLKRFLPTAIGLGFLLTIVTLRNPEVLQERIASFQSRWNASPPTAFIEGQFRWAMRSGAGFLGNGLGTATNSARVFGETSLVETYYPKVLFETGLFGVLAFLLFVTVITYVTFKSYRSLRDLTLRNYAASFWVFVLFISYNTYYYPLDVDPVAVYYWFFAGVILRLPDIEREERQAAKEAEKPDTKKRKRLKRSSGFS
ncbi:MAG TPA: hormogonium polysaccharide biosynthesis protein HpsL [Chroococcidiopsis sp.]